MGIISLPAMPNRDGIRKARTEVFGGYDHNIGAGDGTIWNEANMTSDYYPVMGTRAPRYTVRTISDPQDIYALEGLWWVSGTSLYHDGNVVTSVARGEKSFAAMGKRLIVWPDKIIVNAEDNGVKPVEKTVTASCVIRDGEYAGEEAAGNTIYSAGTNWASYFSVGDGVKISGAYHDGNNKTAVVREIAGSELRFYENAFENEGPVTLTLKREAPELDFICANENRCWGCKGDTIYASKLGDPTNWNVFDGISTDSYAVDAGSEGEFTACCSYLGYPIFFKEEHIYKVYGSRPSNFQLMGSAVMGVKTGSHRTLAVAGETLYYLSRSGIVAYAGGVPETISKAFGLDRFKNGCGGSDGLKYHCVLEREDGGHAHFVWDTRRALWHREDAQDAVGFAFSGGELWMLGTDGKLYGLGLAKTPAGASVENLQSWVETNDFTEGDPNRKGTAKIQLRGELGEDSYLIIRIKFDSGRAGSPSDTQGGWEDVKVLSATEKRSWYLPIIPRRSDHFRLQFTGIGQWRLYSLVRESYSGSEI